MFKAMKGTGIIKKLSDTLSWHSLFTIYKTLVRPHFDYVGIIWNKPNNEISNKKIENIRYNADLPISVAIKGTSQGKLYSE